LPNGPPVLEPADRGALREILETAQRLGFLGPGPLEPQIDRSLAFALVSDQPEHALDLGSGGGLPGLVLAMLWPRTRWTLLDGSVKRTDFLHQVIADRGLSKRIAVVAERAELTGRGPLRGTQDLVVSRGFGPAAVAAECAAPFLRPGGHLVVAEPPGGAPDRWPAEALSTLGLRPVRSMTEPVALQLLEQMAPCPDRYPRRVGIPLKRPLFG
jgi:16S rRNA (guanine527-N7)-methyltransferase